MRKREKMSLTVQVVKVSYRVDDDDKSINLDLFGAI